MENKQLKKMLLLKVICCWCWENAVGYFLEGSVDDDEEGAAVSSVKGAVVENGVNDDDDKDGGAVYIEDKCSMNDNNVEMEIKVGECHSLKVTFRWCWRKRLCRK